MVKLTFLLSVFFAATITIVSCEYDREEEEIVIDPILTDTTATDTTSTGVIDTTTTTIPPVVTYNNTVKAIMDVSCANPSCHVAGVRFPDLSFYSNVKAQSSRVKVRAVDQETMPPSSHPMSSSDRKVLEDWLVAGAKEN